MVALLAGFLAGDDAFASICSASGLGPVTCDSPSVTSRITGNDPENFRNYRGYASNEIGPERIVEVVCPPGGDTITLKVRNTECDIDAFLVDATCDPNGETPIDGSIASWAPGHVDTLGPFWCGRNETYYVILEGWAIDEDNWECEFFGLDCGPVDCPTGEDIFFGLFTEVAESAFTVAMVCPEDCQDGRDNDEDGRTDCVDTECERAAGCYVPEICNDRVDNDVDGFTDCQDSECPGPCRETTTSECTNGVDDDFDGLADCVDPGCVNIAECCDRDRDGEDANTAFCGGSDCDDTPVTGARVNSGASEIVANGVDEDCDGHDLCYVDQDGDGYGTRAGGRVVSAGATCSTSGGESPFSNDCNDNGTGDSVSHPGANEVVGDGIDQDCNGVDACYQDADRDGWGSSVIGDAPGDFCEGLWSPVSGDCQDLGPGAADRGPSEPELCNFVDDDCDGLIDAADPSAQGLVDVWLDADGDGFGAIGASTRVCTPASNQVTRTGDCDDSSFARSPSSPEVCNGVDDDCNGLVDLDDPRVTGTAIWHPDNDFDGYGDPNPAFQLRSCEPIPGWTNDATDCNDSNGGVRPGLIEIPYDGLDQDCAGGDLVDVDGDGMTGAQAGGGDCNDQDPTIRPGLTEDIDGVDQDCDGRVDEGTTWGDDDGDGVSEIAGDCEDGDRRIYPGRRESCDGVDEDCDGEIDEGTECADDDRDNITEQAGDCNDGDASVSPRKPEIDNNGVDDDCDGRVDQDAVDDDRDGYAVGFGDCDGTNGSIHPGATEVLNGVDDNCDGFVDDGTVAFDDDGDGFSEAEGDCDDTDVEVGPGAAEAINGRDDDCDGRVDEVGPYSDDDGDGFSEATGDCDDANVTVRPDAAEVANGVDDDCDGRIDDGADDVDMDGHGAGAGDCDDGNGWVNPEAIEVCDSVDNNCDGRIDEGCAVDLPTDSGWTPPVAKGCVTGDAWTLSGWALLFPWMVRRRSAAERAARGARR